jgi:DNA-binding MarR family transcriptional regulator
MQLVKLRVLSMEAAPSKQTEIAWVLLIRGQQVLLAQVEAALKEAGLPPLPWYDVLLELSRDPDSGLRQYQIGERVLLNKHNLSRLIDRLEGNGLVKRQECNVDGRGNIVKITKKGMKLKQQMWPVYAKAIQELVAEALTPMQVRSLAQLMNALLEKHSVTVP